ncbi:thermonuclease family protein [Bacillus alveayuensis]|uniref:thermonuclease family protein n=1 Tax=Aeribacillus alveayuensis TaxID=279215 RepID=UPI0005CD26B9|nr:thermonuclease family protein [Bacillus alveayuensis]
MKLLKKVLGIPVVLILITFIIACSKQDEFERVVVKLDKVHDGDTISVIINGESETVRFLLVDTPETSHPRLGEQLFGTEAKEYTKKLVERAKKVELEFDIGPKRDKYSRLLAYVYVDGKMVQEELLKRGLARVAYVYPSNSRYLEQIRVIEEESKGKGIGTWEVENYSQEDGFHPEVMESQDKTSVNDKQNTHNGCDIKGNINSKGEKIYHTPDSPWYEQTKAEV